MKKLLYVLFVAVTAMAVTSCKQRTEGQQSDQVDTVAVVDVDEFEQIISDKQNVVLVDVRTTEEFNEGHLYGALQIDVKKDDFRDECIKQLPADKTIAVYCRSGFRSGSAARILKDRGFHVVNLRGGYNAWTEAGKESVKEEEE